MMTCGAQSKPGLAGACSSLEHHQTKAGVPTFADGTDSLRPNLTLFLSFRSHRPGVDGRFTRDEAFARFRALLDHVLFLSSDDVWHRANDGGAARAETHGPRRRTRAR